jgi:hypothetical protein
MATQTPQHIARMAAQKAARQAVPQYPKSQALAQVKGAKNPFAPTHANGNQNNRFAICAIVLAAPTVQAAYTACHKAGLRMGNWDIHYAVTAKLVTLVAAAAQKTA